MTEKGKAEPGENPLVPNARLRELYITMLAARKIEEAVSGKLKGTRKKLFSIRGQEAARTSSVLQLGSEDLVSDVASGPGMALILGGDPSELIREFSAANAKPPAIARALPVIPDSTERLDLVLGSALALRSQGRGGVVVAYLPAKGVPPATLKRVLKIAARYELPIIFMALPAATQEATISRVSSRSGVPGIPVDASDSVALYRVVQESLGRTRAGDGPVLIECLRWKIAGQNAPSDPVEHLKQFLLQKKIAKTAWFRQAESEARRRLRRRPNASKNE